MPTIVVKCPVSGRFVATGIEIDPRSFDRLPEVGAKLRCRACGQEHVWTRADAQLAYHSPPIPVHLRQGAERSASVARMEQ